MKQRKIHWINLARNLANVLSTETFFLSFCFNHRQIFFTWIFIVWIFWGLDFFFFFFFFFFLFFFFWTFFLGFVLSWISISYLIVSTANRLLSCCLSHLWLVMYKMTTNHQLGQKEQMAVHFFLSIPSNFFNCVFFFYFCFVGFCLSFSSFFSFDFFMIHFVFFQLLLSLLFFLCHFFFFNYYLVCLDLLISFFVWFLFVFFVFLIALFRFPCLTWDLSRFQLLKSMVSARWRRRRGRGEIVSAAGARWRQPPATPTAAR